MTSHWLPPLGMVVLSLAFTPVLHGAGKDVKAVAALIDQRLAAAWDKDVKPAPVADDAEFFRRLHLDLAGRIPSVTEIRDFLDDDRPEQAPAVGGAHPEGRPRRSFLPRCPR